jgi:hypothetical protein
MAKLNTRRRAKSFRVIAPAEKTPERTVWLQRKFCYREILHEP